MSHPDRRPVGMPDYAALTPDDIHREVAASLRLADERMGATLARWSAASAGGSADADEALALLDGVSDAARAVWAGHALTSIPALVHPDPAVRAAAGEAGERIEAWRARTVRDPALLAALEGTDAADLDHVAAVVRDRWIAALRRAGAHLDAGRRAELDALAARLPPLQAQFAMNQAADDASIEVERRRLGGLPEAVLMGLAGGKAPGTVVVPIALRQTVLERVVDRGVREIVQRRWFGVAAAPNRRVLEEMIGIHRRMAALLGYGSWAAARADGGSAGGTAGVERLLDELEPAFVAARDRQLDAIRRPLAAEIGIAEAELRLEDWDVPRGLALLRDELGADGAALREYFPLDAVLIGLARCLDRVFGVTVAEEPIDGAWHPDVRRLDLADSASGLALGTILFDPFAREGKLTGMAGVCDVLHLGDIDGDGGPGPTHAAVVLFLNAPTDGAPALLAPSDIEALFHELGHALDFILGTKRFAPLDSDAWIPDWTEAPSQAVGRWAALPEILAELGRHVTTGEPLALERARSFARANETGVALDSLRFLWLARLDGALHGPARADLDAAWRSAWPIRGTAASIDRFVPAPLMIIALGYDGVMYGFLWAQALLEEVIERFRQEGPLTPAVGRAYRRDLLEPGWAPDPIARMRTFLGREPSLGPYLARLER